MAGFHVFSPRPYGELREPWLGEEPELEAQLGWPEPPLSSWTRTPSVETQTRAPWVPSKCLPTGRSRRRGDMPSPRESHSLTHVAQRPSDRAKKHRSGSGYLEEAFGETSTKPSRNWQQQPDQPCPRYRVARGGSPRQSPREAFNRQNIGTLPAEKTPSADRWAVPEGRPVDLCSPPSVLTDKSSVPSLLEFQKQPCVCSHKRGSGDRIETLANQYSRPSASFKELSSQPSRVLKSKLDEAVISSRDQKIIALVLSRLRKAQRIRELQQQAAVAWEELKLSDQEVHMTLERECRLLLQQSQEQWQGQEELHKPGGGQEQPRQGHEQPGSWQDCQAKNAVQTESKTQWTVRPDHQENPDLDKLDRVQAQAEHLKQCQEQRLREQEKMLQSLRDLNRMQMEKRLQAACCKRQQHMAEEVGNEKKVQESNLSSLINFQARRVLMDCQAKAEELLRKLSLEQRGQRFQDIQESLVRERHQEQQEKAQSEEEQFQRAGWWPAEEAEEESKRVLAELAQQKIRQTRSHAQKTTKDRAHHLRELNILREKNHHITKLKAEKEEKSHIEGIKEAIKKKEQRVEQMTPRKDPIFQEYQKVSPTSKTNHCFDPMAAEAYLL
ncbi:coiled-coil domain-containing protein 185 [Psammomys obesus]|uniref:coiled-coil domain-containing protein 185 n=1 Tax=Psammomys obesus TaxID=48139 RepID=UPI002452BAFB|nr:coiled-coil domain-containing protein 185 [Psammomys obesus]